MSGIIAMFIRSLREHTRSASLAATRGIFAAVVLWFLFVTGHANPTVPGLDLLRALQYLNLFFAALAAVSYFSSSITEEKEDGTIDLLLMANTSASGFLLAKCGSRIVEGLLLLAVQFPFALLAVALGGVTWQQIAASYVALAAFVFLAANIALLASLIASRTREAAFFTALALLVVVAGSALVPGSFGVLKSLITSINPLVRLSGVMELSFNGNLTSSQLWNSLLVGCCVFFATRLLFDRFVNRGAWNVAGLFAKFSSSADDRSQCERPLSTMAIEWKDYHFLQGGDRFERWKKRGYFAAAVVFSLPALWSWDDSTVSHIGGVLTILGVTGAFIEASYSASTMFRSERQQKTIASLLLIPDMSPSELLRYKERVAEYTIRTAGTLTSTGIVVSILGTLFSANVEKFATMAFGGPLAFIFLAPFFLIHKKLLQRILIHVSLRFDWGGAAAGIGIWLVYFIVSTTAMSLYMSFVGFYASLIPSHFLSKSLSEKNVVLLEKCAAEEA
jgi:ABC-type transport system involved in cytochrome c biogenesis permease component